MNPEEYQHLARIDCDHWFYRGKRRIVRHWLDRFLSLEPDDLLIDAGMGTGTWLVEMAPRCRVLGIDDHAESLALAAPRVQAAGGKVLQSSLLKVPLPDGLATVVTLLDVLEHIPEDAAALREAIRLTRPGGLVIVTVPALRWLWSDWDVALHHIRRYTCRELRLLLSQPGVRLLHCAYFNTAALLPIATIRWLRRLRPEAAGTGRLENRLPPVWVNRCLESLLVWPACAGWFPAPVGVSLLAVLRHEPAGF